MQKEESTDAAASSESVRETDDEPQEGAPDPVSDDTMQKVSDEFEANSGEEDAVVLSVPPAVEASPEELAELYDEIPDSLNDSEEKPKKKKWKRVLIAVVSVPLAIIIALLGTFFVMREIGRKNIHESKKFEVVLPTEDESNKQIVLGDKYGRIINYNGVSYVYNNDIIALTFIKVKMLNISRDIITDVDVYSTEGAFIDTEEIQIAYSNAYSGEGITGGDNTNKSISRLMYGLPMDNYFELDLDAVSTLNDAIGGVTVTSAMTFVSPEDGRTIYEGEEVTLHGTEAEYYVRNRDINELESNNDRMQRQQDYIMSYLSSIVPVAKRNPGVISDLYTAISNNSETSLSATELIYIASSAVENLHSVSDIEIIRFDGEITAGINAEMHVKDEEVLSKMLDIFYEPLNTGSTEATDSAVETAAPSVAAAESQTAAVTAEATQEEPTGAVQETQ